MIPGLLKWDRAQVPTFELNFDTFYGALYNSATIQ